ncbi:M20/M25/M40 family metallo-hydrolase [Parasphingopyxis lamellibrachiae]|uniref:Glutamate carboxypeptidase n=1 Tax=Parasphingopyxis lamellibrachiae TaxID=680125 RepID=A0A3D9FIE1_9SPHN|nr:M20/M25/M40 family metallo-hydrolase [Parasphingopyxis lamellibrachiae]RED17569.1 glutamate carboxypeptidase [Parasphingopyxis lamellibrachiae]
MKPSKFIGLCALAALASGAPAQAELSSAEQRMTETVDAEMERTVSLLERVVNQNSGTRNVEGNRAVMAMLRPEFEALGFTVEIIDQDEVDRAGHFFARREGHPANRRILLIGHTDTVFEPDSAFQTFTRNGDRATGPGVVDDKGGVAVIIAALRAMHEAGTLEGANIVVALTGDEEDFGEPAAIGRRDLVEAGQWADIALGFEGLAIRDGQDMGTIARRSSNSWTLTTSGNQGHSSTIFSDWAGDGAIYEMARIISRFRSELPEPNLTFNVGLLAGGTTAELDEQALRAQATGKTNIIPPIAIARGDFRTLSQEQTDRVRARMREIVADHAPGTGAEILFDEGYPPMAPTAGNRALFDRLNSVNSDLGLPEMGLLDPALRGAADIAFVAEYTDALAGLGAAGEGSHGPAETIDLSVIPRQAKRAAILISRLAAEER